MFFSHLARLLHTYHEESRLHILSSDTMNGKKRRRPAGFPTWLLACSGVDPGMGRLTAYAQIDDYRDNWWCDVERREINRSTPSAAPVAAPQAPGFLSAALQAIVSDERRKLDALEIGPNDLCTRVVEWAKRSPADPRVPEALHLAVKATRYGCRDEKTRQRSKLAFDILHKQYPDSVWAQQTKYYYGNN